MAANFYLLADIKQAGHLDRGFRPPEFVTCLRKAPVKTQWPVHGREPQCWDHASGGVEYTTLMLNTKQGLSLKVYATAAVCKSLYAQIFYSGLPDSRLTCWIW